MSRTFVRSKIQKATVTRTDLHYEGSITLDPKLMEAAGIAPFEQVHVLNLDNGARVETYAIEGRRGSGEVCMNGPAARHAVKGDRVIILSYEEFPQAPPKGYAPTVVLVTPRNKVARIKKGA